MSVAVCNRLPLCLSNINLFDVIFVNYPLHAHLLFHYNFNLAIYQIRCGSLMPLFCWTVLLLIRWIHQIMWIQQNHCKPHSLTMIYWFSIAFWSHKMWLVTSNSLWRRFTSTYIRKNVRHSFAHNKSQKKSYDSHSKGWFSRSFSFCIMPKVIFALTLSELLSSNWNTAAQNQAKYI